MLKFLALDRFTILLFVMVLLASVLPVSGQAAEVFGWVTTGAIAILFFLHGAKLSREAVVQGIMHWKLHTLVFCANFCPVSDSRAFGQADFITHARTGTILGFPVYVFPAIHRAVLDRLYFSGSWQCRRGGM